MTATAIDILRQARRETIEDLVALVPKILTAVIILVAMALLTYVVVKLVRRLLDIARIDELVRPFIERYGIPFTITNVIVVITVFGMSMLTIYTVAAIVFPEYLGLVTTAIDVVSRIASVVFLIIFVFTSITITVERIRMERGMRGFMLLLTLLIAILLVVDVTNLSREVKEALAWGLSLGIGLSIGVFTAWYFFGDVIRRRTESK